jgi:hypothetical protein
MRHLFRNVHMCLTGSVEHLGRWYENDHTTFSLSLFHCTAPHTHKTHKSIIWSKQGLQHYMFSFAAQHLRNIHFDYEALNKSTFFSFLHFFSVFFWSIRKGFNKMIAVYILIFRYNILSITYCVWEMKKKEDKKSFIMATGE